MKLKNTYDLSNWEHFLPRNLRGGANVPPLYPPLPIVNPTLKPDVNPIKETVVNPTKEPVVNPTNLLLLRIIIFSIYDNRNLFLILVGGLHIFLQGDSAPVWACKTPGNHTFTDPDDCPHTIPPAPGYTPQIIIPIQGFRHP